MNGKVEILFDDRVVYERMEVTDLQPAYAISIHKRGQRVPRRRLPNPQHFMMLKRSRLHRAYQSQEQGCIRRDWRPAMAIKNHKTW